MAVHSPRSLAVLSRWHHVARCATRPISILVSLRQAGSGVHRECYDSASLRMLKFSPGIKGLAKPCSLRAVATEGCLWFVERNVRDAAGWHQGTIRYHRTKALTRRVSGSRRPKTGLAESRRPNWTGSAIAVAPLGAADRERTMRPDGGRRTPASPRPRHPPEPGGALPEREPAAPGTAAAAGVRP